MAQAQTSPQPQRKDRTGFWKTLMKVLNPFMKGLLRSPLHAVVSGSYMLITVTGRKSGRLYTTPVQYKRDGGRVDVITSANYTWWKNLRGGAPVELVVRGKQYHGQATTSTESAAIREAAQRIYPNMTEVQFSKLMDNTVAITITLENGS